MDHDAMPSPSPLDTSLRPAAAAAVPGQAVSVAARAAGEVRPIIALRYLDVVCVLVAAAPVLALGGPSLGFLVGGGAWLLQRALQANDRRLTARIQSQTQRAGWRLFEAFGRIWLLAGAIVTAGVVGERRDGLAAALTIFGAYSIALAIRLISGPPAGTETP
jgi:hypothetical protein